MAAALGAQAVELHTGTYANAGDDTRANELASLARGGAAVTAAGMILNAGHGLTYRNVTPIACLEGMHELNIGHSIVARAVLVGFTQAVKEMKSLIAPRSQ